MFLIHKLVPLIAIALLLQGSANAQETETIEQLRTTLAERFPSVGDVKISATPFPNLYEVYANEEIVYITADGAAIIAGHLIDTQSKIDLTEQRLQAINAISFKALPLDKSIVIRRGNGERRVAIFEDPYCIYCKRIEATLKDMSDITIYVFLLPIIRSESKATSRDIWCSKDQAQAWQDWILRNQKPLSAPKACSDPTVEILAMAQKLKIRSTPTLFFTDGKRVSGAIPRDKLEEYFAHALIN